MDGVLLLDKPIGPTSHDLVAKIRRLLGTRKVGHAGTLDPFASGLLVMLIGQATKISSFLLNADKTYEAELKLGAATDTLDHTGQINDTAPVPPLVTRDVELVLSAMIGKCEQTPPMFSAVKVDGAPLHRTARRGKEVERKAKIVHIHALTLLECGESRLRFRVVCSKGTYVRVLGAALAERLGTVGHLTALRRTHSGQFSLRDAVTLEELTAAAEKGRAEEYLISLDRALTNYHKVKLTPSAGCGVTHGVRPPETGILAADDFQRGDVVRLVNGNDRLLALAKAVADAGEAKDEQAGSPFELLRVFTEPGA
ncbi:MAG TPA: tRNA pseudouridine(55) synthase TruB [bacterium]|nr:tRNA pseudouridine(55) synthase TruB [bacterium]